MNTENTFAPGMRLNTGVHELNPTECHRLLETQTYGRLGVVVEGQPEIFPVNYGLDLDHCVIFKTTQGRKLASAVNHRVAFEVDHVDPISKRGWSVVVHGVAHHTQRVAPGPTPLTPWLPDRPIMVRLTCRSITGRYVGPLPAELAEREDQ